MKKKLLAMAMAGTLSVSMVIPTFAISGQGSEGGAIPYADGTEVYAGIIINDPDARIKVEVPTLFAFVVNGTIKNDTTGVSAADGEILLPNVKVAVDTTSGDYAIQTVGSGNLKFTNYSTRASVEEDSADAIVDGRIGLEVTLSGAIRNEETAASRNNWEHVGDAETLSANLDGFKKYTLEVNEQKFDKPTMDGSLAMANALELEAPNLPVKGLDKVTGLAQLGEVIEATFNVHIGGQLGQYKQVEESAKVGTIVWTISADVENSGDIPTSPDKDPLDSTTEPNEDTPGI